MISFCDGHEIAFDGETCPLCEADHRIEELEEENSGLKQEIEGLKNKMADKT